MAQQTYRPTPTQASANAPRTPQQAPAPAAAQPASTTPPTPAPVHATPIREARIAYESGIEELGVATTMFVDASHKLGPLSRTMMASYQAGIRSLIEERDAARKEVERLNRVSETLIAGGHREAPADRPQTEGLEVALNSVANLLLAFEPAAQDATVAPIVAALEGTRTTLLRWYQYAQTCDKLDEEDDEPEEEEAPPAAQSLGLRLGALLAGSGK